MFEVDVKHGGGGGGGWGKDQTWFFTHAPCSSMGQQMDFFLSFSVFSFTPPIFFSLLGTENAVGRGSFAVMRSCSLG